MCHGVAKSSEKTIIRQEIPTRVQPGAQPISIVDMIDDLTFFWDIHISKAVFFQLLNKMHRYYEPSRQADFSPYEVVILHSLRYLTSGVVSAGDREIRYLPDFLAFMEQSGCENWISIKNWNCCRYERKTANNFFEEKYSIPGVTGCIDRIEITANDQSLSTLVVCDQNRRVKHIEFSDPEFGDDCVWKSSYVRTSLMGQQQDGVSTNRLIADGKFSEDLCLVLPQNSEDFNSRHELASKVMRGTIDDLKFQFKCLAKKLPFDHDVAALVFKVCCVIYNMHL